MRHFGPASIRICGGEGERRVRELRRELRERSQFATHLTLLPVEREALPLDRDAREHARREAHEAAAELLLAAVAHPGDRAALRVQLADLGDLALAEEGVNLRRGLERGRLGQYPSHGGGS